MQCWRCGCLRYVSGGGGAAVLGGGAGLISGGLQTKQLCVCDRSHDVACACVGGRGYNSKVCYILCGSCVSTVVHCIALLVTCIYCVVS